MRKFGFFILCLTFIVIFVRTSIASADSQLKKNAIVFSVNVNLDPAAANAVKEQNLSILHLQDQLTKVTHDVLSKIVKNKFDYQLYSSGDAPEGIGEHIENFFFGIRVLIRDGKQLNPPVEYLLVTANPTFSASFSSSEKVYSLDPQSYGAPLILSLGKDVKLFLSEYEATITPMLERIFIRAICSKAANKTNDACKKLCVVDSDIMNLLEECEKANNP